MTAAALTAAVNVLIALALAYFPGLRELWDPLPSVRKSMWIGALLVLTAVVFTGLSCAGVGFPGYTAECTQTGIMSLVTELVTALAMGIAGSQGTYSLAVRPYKQRDMAGDVPEM